MEYKNIEKLSCEELIDMGDEIGDIPETSIILWTIAHPEESKDILPRYRKGRIKKKVEKEYDNLFEPDRLISMKLISSVLEIDMFATYGVLDKLLEGDFVEKKDNHYIMLENDRERLVDEVASTIWSYSFENIDVFVQFIRKNTLKIINSMLIDDADFLNAVNSEFRLYNPDLLNKDKGEKLEFFTITMHNTSRSYVLSIIAMRYLYKRLIDNAELYTDEFWAQKIKNEYALENCDSNDYKSYSAYMKFIKEETSELIRIFPAIFMDGTFGISRIMMFFNFGFPRANVFREQLCKTGLLSNDGKFISPFPAEAIYPIPLANGLITEVFCDKMLEKAFGDDSSSMQIILQNQKMVEGLLEKYIIEFNHIFGDLLTIELKNGAFVLNYEDSFKYGHDLYPNDFELCHVISSCLQIMTVKAFYSIINQKSETVRFNPLFVIQTELNSGLQIKHSDRIAVFADALNADVYTFYKRNRFKKFTPNDDSLSEDQE